MAENAKQRRMRSRRDEQPIVRRRQGAAAQPVRRGVLVRLHAAEALVTHQRYEIAPDSFEPILHAIEQLWIVGLGREIHREINDLGVARHQAMRPPR